MRPRARLLLGVALAAWAAAACPTVDQGEVPVTPEACRPDLAQFTSTVWPNAIANADKTKSCVANAGCHARETGRSALRLIALPTTPGDYQMNYEAVTRFLNCSTPAASPFVTKPTAGGDPHAGGDLWTSGEEPEKTVEAWISGTL
jgi:hypothetical protein